jgi:hypothetical protein
MEVQVDKHPQLQIIETTSRASRVVSKLRVEQGKEYRNQDKSRVRGTNCRGKQAE